MVQNVQIHCFVEYRERHDERSDGEAYETNSRHTPNLAKFLSAALRFDREPPQHEEQPSTIYYESQRGHKRNNCKENLCHSQHKRAWSIPQVAPDENLTQIDCGIYDEKHRSKSVGWEASSLVIDFSPEKHQKSICCEENYARQIQKNVLQYLRR